MRLISVRPSSHLNINKLCANTYILHNYTVYKTVCTCMYVCVRVHVHINTCVHMTLFISTLTSHTLLFAHQHQQNPE